MEYKERAAEKVGPRNFRYVRKISLSNYDPRRKFETEDYEVVHDSFEEARQLVEKTVNERIAELSGAKQYVTKQ